MTFHGLTIDDTHSQDLDDSVWAEQVDGGTLLTVCIADVAGAVPRGHKYDEKAHNQVETRYWAGGNTPMFPRFLADCDLSLHPGRERNVVGIQMLLDSSLDLVGEPTVRVGTLKSKAKLAYDMIPGLLDLNPGPFHGMLNLLKRVALGLLEKRRQAGALAFYDLNEGWTTTEEGQLLKLERAQANVGYILIQEAMILTNQCFARFAATNSIPVLFRNHTAKIVAPAREEILRQLDAVRLDPSQVAALRQRVHTVMNKATYDPVILGHYGLSLPYYLHGSSPIRRYADVVTQRQIRAHIQGEPLPYTQEEVGQEGVHIMTKLREAEERKSAAFKERAEERAIHRASTYGVDKVLALPPKDFERVLKVVTRLGEHNLEVAEAVHRKLQEGTLAVLDMFIVLSATPVWGHERQAVIDYLAKNTYQALSVCSVGLNLSGWSPVDFTEHREGPPHSVTFRVSATVRRGDEVTTTPEVVATPLKLAKGQAAVNLLAILSGVEPPQWPKVTPKSPVDSAEVVIIDPSINPVNALQEHAQKNKVAFPEYIFERAGGEDHTPLFTCTCTYQGVQQTSLASVHKKAAKKNAAGLLWDALTDRTRE